VRSDVGDTGRRQRSLAQPLHAGRRGDARRTLHHLRSPALGDEHEPGADVRVGAARAFLARALDLLRRAAARHARGRGVPSAPWRRRPVREAPSFQRSTLHLSVRVPALNGGLMATNHYDVIIIGTGAGGGTLAHHLAPTGKRILLLERGDYVPREAANWSDTEVFVNNRYISEDPWTDDKGNTFQPQIHYFVGGATKMYGAALYRLRAQDC